MQKWQDDLAGADTRVLAITTDSVRKNKRVARRFGIEFPILSDPSGSILKALDMWDPRWSIASYGYYLLDDDLNVVNWHKGSWEPTEQTKSFFLKQIAAAMANREAEG